jgi:hypothetical protein
MTTIGDLRIELGRSLRLKKIQREKDDKIFIVRRFLKGRVKCDEVSWEGRVVKPGILIGDGVEVELLSSVIKPKKGDECHRQRPYIGQP